MSKEKPADEVPTGAKVTQNATEDGSEDQKIGNRSYLGTTPEEEPAGSLEGD